MLADVVEPSGAVNVFFWAGGIVALVMVYQFVLRPLWHCVHSLTDGVQSLLHDNVTLMADNQRIMREVFPIGAPSLRQELVTVRQQVLPNGGASLKDQLGRVETAQVTINAQLVALGKADEILTIAREKTTEQLTGTTTRIDEVITRLGATNDRLDRHLEQHGADAVKRPRSRPSEPEDLR